MKISITHEGKTSNLEVDDTSEIMELKIRGPTRELILRFGTDPEALLKIYISTLGAKLWEVEVKKTETIGTVMAKIHEMGGPPVDQQRLIHQGKHLGPNRTMADCDIKTDTTLVMMSELCGC